MYVNQSKTPAERNYVACTSEIEVTNQDHSCHVCNSIYLDYLCHCDKKWLLPFLGFNRAHLQKFISDC